MKITAQQLRIGNIYNYFIEDKSDPRKEWWEVSVCDAADLVYLEKNPNDRDFEGILLTEAWLLKFGFIKELDSFYRKNKSSMIEICFYDNGIIATSQSVCLSYINNVHQLQNLFFSLTGQELPT